MSRVMYLVDRITKCAQDYYTTGESDLSDFEYDNLIDELEQLDPNNPILNLTGNGYSLVGIDEKEKFEHPLDVGSIRKTKSVEELIKFLDERSTASTKIDGNSVVAYYKDGKLVNVVTRGENNIGLIRTEKFVIFNLVPKTIPLKDYVMVRGEVAILKSKYTEENDFDIEKSSRNSVCGAITRIDNWEYVFKHLDFIAYTFINIDTDENIENIIDWTKYFKVEKQVSFNSDHPLLKDLDALKKVFKTDYPYDSDGIVFKNSSGDMLAFKFKDEIGKTKLRSIDIKIGTNQQLTPVGWFDSIKLAGANIKKASLNSFSRAIDIGCWPLKEDHNIEMIRANEIIPYILNGNGYGRIIQDKIICPCCGSIGEFNGKHAFCINKTCSNIQRSKTIKFASMFYPDDFSNKTLIKILDHLKIYSVIDLIKLKDEPNIDRLINDVVDVGESKRTKFKELISKFSKPIKSQIIYTSIIDACGESSAIKIVDSGFKLCSYLSDENEIQKLYTIPSFVSNIWHSLAEHRELIKNISEICEIFDEIITAKVGSFTITGARFKDDVKSKLSDLGWREDKSLKRTTNYLIVKDTSKTSEKTIKAKEYGTTIISIDEFLKKVGL